MFFGIDYNDDVDKVMGIILCVVEEDGCILKSFEFWVKVMEFGVSLVDIIVWLWCLVDDYWNVKFELMKVMKEIFDVEGILILYLYVV